MTSRHALGHGLSDHDLTSLLVPPRRRARVDTVIISGPDEIDDRHEPMPDPRWITTEY